MFLTVREIIDIFIAVIATGYIFMDTLRRPGGQLDTFGNRLLFSIAVAAPAVVLHEFGHKIVALMLGYTAIFHAAYMWLGLGIVLKLINFPLLFFVPAYVSIYGPSGVPHALVALSGPVVNALLWVVAWALLKMGKWSRTTEAALFYTKMINMFLFVFNMLPIPGFDGWNVYTNLF